MTRIGVYPGTFDPITYGHLDIINRSLPLFDEVIVGIAVNSKKTSMFSMEERQELIRKSIPDTSKLKISTFSGLTVDFCLEIGAKTIIRGLRAVTDFEYEYAIALTNKKLALDVETIFFMASAENSFISSTIVKEIARHGRSVESYAPDVVNEALIKKFQNQQNK
ncbi:MAG: pantetheine-phosphate adenylyltransferase [Spirochaetota bacterium]